VCSWRVFPPWVLFRSSGFVQHGTLSDIHLTFVKRQPTRNDCVSCCRNVGVLRASAMSWVPVLCAAFVEAAPEARGPLGEALAAYACICAPDVVAGFFRTAVQKLIKVPCCFG
jgi:hypothetical protein